MVGRIDQQRRYFAVPKRSKSAFDSSILFRAGEIKDTHLHLPQGHLYVAGYRLELGRIGRKEGFGFRQRLRLRPYNQLFGLSCGMHTHLGILLYAYFRVARNIVPRVWPARSFPRSVSQDPTILGCRERLSTPLGRKKERRAEIHREWSGARPPAASTQWTCG